MKARTLASQCLGLWLIGASVQVMADPVVYEIDPSHTYPSFEGDHMGISVWRGKFNQTTGTLTLDKTTGKGHVDVTIDMNSVDFGHDEMNQHARDAEFFDVDRYPTAVYRGDLRDFRNGVPTRVRGDLTLHGVTRPVELQIDLFRCIEHPVFKRELCGADALATFDRSDFGLDAGKDYGFDMKVTVRIQMEAIAKPAPETVVD